MSVERVRTIAHWAIKQGLEELVFLGGEPSLHPQFGELLAIAAGNPSLRTRITTNGTRPFLQALLSERLDRGVFVSVSLDGGTPATHDAVRGKGSYELCMKTLRELSRREMTYGITLTVTAMSAPETDQVMELAKQLGCSVLNVHWFSRTGRGRGKEWQLRPIEWKALCEHIRRHRVMAGNCAIRLQVAYAHRDMLGSSGTTMCAVRDRSNLQFMPDGRVLLCGLVADTPNLAALRWEDHKGLVESHERSERSLCDSFTGTGCPLRQVLLHERVDDSGLVPLCIYEKEYL